MIALGGVIGTGFFLGSGYTINQADQGSHPFIFSRRIYYVFNNALSWRVNGSDAGFRIFPKVCDEVYWIGTGFMIGWLYWLGWAVTVGLELTSIGLMMKRWFPNVDVWVWCLVFGVILYASNAISAKSYAELEFWFSSIKVITILAFVVLGGSALLGFISYDGKEATSFL